MFKHLSYSHLHMLACPYSAWLKYSAAVKGPTTKWIALGNAVHHGVQFGHIEGYFNLEESLNQFKEEFVRIVEDETVSLGWPELKKMEAEGIEMLVMYDAQINEGIISSSPLALEESFEIPFLDTTIIGRIDKLEQDDQGYIVTDFKTGKTKPTQWSLSHNVQLSVYSWAVLEKYGELPHTSIWHHMRTGELLKTTRTMQDIEDVQSMVSNAIKMNEMGIKHRIFHDDVCGMCDFRGDMCDDREFEHKVEETLAAGDKMLPQIYVKPKGWT